MNIETPIWPYAYGSPSGAGKLRTLPEDFIVHENLSFEPSGSGEHAFLQLQKTDENTDYVARQLAKFAMVRQRDVGYAGLKDRHAITTQWFSVWLPGKLEMDWATFETANIKILAVTRHARKLKRGVLTGNSFKVTVRNWHGDPENTTRQLTLIESNGIPNYYGEQRFGNQAQNVNKAMAMFKGEKVKREQRSLYLSAARSYLFNQLLSVRVSTGTWNQALAGDTFMFDCSKSCFKSQMPDPEILRRVDAKTIHPTGVLWGKGEIDVAGDALAAEQNTIDNHCELAQGLVASGVEKARRPLRVNVEKLEWQFVDPTTLRLSFTLPAGSYATSLLREIIGSQIPSS